MINLTVEPQHIAVPVALIAVNNDGRPVLIFYVQLNTTTFVAAATVSMAVEVSEDSINFLNLILCWFQSADDLYRQAGLFPLGDLALIKFEINNH